MIIKNCPFCGSQISFNLNENCIVCQNCIQNGIVLKVYGDSYESIVEKWNNRDFDNKFLESLDYIQEYCDYLKSIKDDYSNKDIPEEILQIQSNLKSCGCIIYENGKIESVDIEHDLTIMRLLRINDRKLLPEDDDEVYDKLNLVKVTFIYKYISCFLPNRITNNQLNSLEIFLIKNSNWCESFEFTNLTSKNTIKLNKIEDASKLIKDFKNGKKIYTI